jgi:rhodanese-related sulfurtransferase
MLKKEQLSAINFKELMEQDDIKVFPLDVRSQPEYNRYHIKGSLNIHIENLSIEVLEKTLNLDKSEEKIIVVTYCNAGGRGGRSFSLLKEQNTNPNIIIKNLQHGINEWILAGFEIEENI